MKIEQATVVVDAGPLIHLDELQSLDLLGDIAHLLAPQVVWHEVKTHRPNLTSDQINGFRIAYEKASISAQLLTLSESFALDIGEIEAVALAEKHQLMTFLTDDSAARLAAEFLGFHVHGTIGVLVRSIRRGLRSQSEVLDTLSSIRNNSTLHISESLLLEIITQIKNSN